MKLRTLITVAVALLILGGCCIEPPLHLRKVVSTQVVMQTSITADVLWQVNWETKWEYNWKTEVLGPVGYTPPKGVRMHVYTLDDKGAPKSHNVYNFSGDGGSADVFVGTHDLLFHNNDSEVLLFSADDELAPPIAYTRIISSGLKESLQVKTVAQKSAAQKASLTKGEGDDGEIPDEQVAYMPDELFVLCDRAHHITDDLSEYEFIGGKYVLRISGDMQPRSYIWLFEITLLNNNGRVVGSMGGAALTGMAHSVNMYTGITSETTVSVPMDVYMDKNDNPDMLGARALGFGIPGCDAYKDESVAAAPEGKHWFVLNVSFNTGQYKNVRIDITDQIRALPTGGVIKLEIDVEDFAPEPTDPTGEGGGFNALIGDWDEEHGSATIIN